MGRRVVDQALDYPAPAPISADLVETIDARLAEGLPALERWMRSLDVPTLAAVVAVIAGEVREHLREQFDADNASPARLDPPPSANAIEGMVTEDL